MTGYQRYRRMLESKSTDLLPRIPILMAFAARYIDSTYASFASDFKTLVKANIRCAREIGFDQVSAISDPYRETAGFGAEIEYVTDGVPRCMKPPLQDAKDLSLLRKPDPFHSPRMLDRVRAVESYRASVYKEHSILGWVEGPAAEAADLRGAMNFFVDLLDDESFVVELMALSTEVGVQFAQAQVDAGADTIGIGDSVASQVSAGIYEKLILPFEKQLVDAVHRKGALVRLHICGDISHLLVHIPKLGVDILDLDWKVDMKEARRILPGVALAGNLNPVDEVQRGTPEQIAMKVRQLYADIGNPYCIAAGCEIPVTAPIDNLRALCLPIEYAPTPERQFS